LYVDVHVSKNEAEDVLKNESQSVEPDKKNQKFTTFYCWKFFTRIGVSVYGKERAR